MWPLGVGIIIYGSQQTLAQAQQNDQGSVGNHTLQYQ